MYLRIIVSLIYLELNSFCNGQSLDRPPLLACTEYEILMTDVTTFEMHSLFKPDNRKSSGTITRFSSVDYHYGKNLIVIGQFPWPSGTRGEIATAKLINGTLIEMKTIISSTGNQPMVAVDWIMDKIYWKCKRGVCGRHGAIYMANLDGTGKQLVQSIITTDTSNFQLDPINRWIYLRSKTAALNYFSPTYDVLKRIDMDNNDNHQTLDTCDDDLCFFRFAIDNTENGKVYWMNFMSSTVKSVDTNNMNNRTYDFSEFEFEKILYIHRKIIDTIDVSFTIAHKGSLYGLPEYRLYDLAGSLARVDTRNINITYLPALATSVKLETYRVFHPSAQPTPSARRKSS